MDLKKIIKDTVKTNWRNILLKFDTKELDKFLTEEKEKFDDILDIYPPEPLIFNAFRHFDFEDTKVVIIGQDPYINPGQAMGMSFSVPSGEPLPPSLRNIFQEIETDLGISMKERSGDLTPWAKQGVLLINAALTTLQGKSNRHQKKWEKYTDKIIKYISDHGKDIVFILWGNNAKSKKSLIDLDKHHIVEGVHPSPLSANRGFFGSEPFSKTNAILKKIGKEPIDWS